MAITRAQGFAFVLTTLALVMLIAGNAAPIWKLNASDMSATVATWRTCGDIDIAALDVHLHDCMSTQSALKYLQEAATVLGSYGGGGNTTCTSSVALKNAAYGSIAIGLIFVAHLVAIVVRHRVTLQGFLVLTLCIPLPMGPAICATIAVLRPLCDDSDGDSVTLQRMPGSSLGAGLALLWVSFLFFMASALIGYVYVGKRPVLLEEPEATAGDKVQYVTFTPTKV